MIRRGLMLLGLLLLCLGLYRLPASLSRRIDLAAFLPARSALAGTVGRAAPDPDSALEMEHLRKKINDLDRQFKAMGFYSTTLSGKPPRMLGARVFLRGDTSSWRQTCYIDAGSDDGVAKGQVVADRQGVIGIVSAVSRTYSRVALLTDPASKVRAYVQAGSKTYPVVAEGSAEATLRLRFVPLSAPIRPSDPVYTAGTEGTVPRNLLIGTVKKVRRNDSGLDYEVSLTPAGRLRTAVNVVVFLRTVPREIDP